MSYSLSDIQAMGDAFLAQVDAMVPAYVSIFDEITAVDPAAADATTHLDALQVARNALKDSFAGPLAELNVAIKNTGFFTSDAEVKAFVNEVYAKGTAKLAAGKTGPQLDAAIVDKRGAVSAVEKKTAEEAAASTTPAGTSDSGAIPTSTTGLTGTADGDKGGDKGGSAIPTTTAGAAVAAASGNTPNSAAPAAKGSKKLPKDFPERMSNPLSKFSSYTYQLSLYMLSPDAYNLLSISDAGRTLFAPGKDGAPNVGVSLIAQSGGANNKMGIDTRAPGFELDFYIDNLKLTGVTNGKMNATMSNTVNVEFNIIEPYGFSFMTKLRTAGEKLMASSKLKGTPDNRNPLKKTFVLGIRFQGYDKDGKVMTSADLSAEDTMNVNATGVFERYLDLQINEMHFKIDGKATTYTLKGVNVPIGVAYTTKRGRVSNEARIIATTVAEAIGARVDKDGKSIPGKKGTKGLLDIMNENQQALANAPVQIGDKEATATGIATVYKLRFLDGGDGTTSPIGDATLTRTLSRDKTRAPPSASKTTTGSNEATAVKASPDLGTYTVTFKNDTPIMQAISEIIKHSSYLSDAQKTLSKNTPESNSNNKKEGGEITGGGEMLRWYNLSTDVKVLGWDAKVGDWAYEITYVIQPYDTPAVSTTYSNPPAKYYGPHKRYNYWYSGKNSEIIQYEQTLNTAWFTSVLAATGDNSAQGGKADISTTVNVPNTGIKTGALPGAMDAQNAYVTSLYDPGGWVTAKIKILGDPDFLTVNPPGGVNDVYSQFYHTDRTINANGGQVFIEINFTEGVDYNNTTGTMDLNSDIFIRDYPPEAMIEGVSYEVLEVKSTFNGGSFIQEITANAVTNLPAATKTATDAARPVLAPPGRGASSEGNAGEAEARENLAAQTGEASAAQAGLAAQAAASQITSKAAPAVTAFNAAKDSQLYNATQGADTPAGYSPARDSAAANEVANDDAAVKASDLSVYPANNPDAGRENLSQTDRASGA